MVIGRYYESERADSCQQKQTYPHDTGGKPNIPGGSKLGQPNEKQDGD
jgi:hypothetical protein